MSTRLQGPYDEFSTVEKRRIQCMIPEELADSWFLRRFPMSGVQDKVLSRLFHGLDTFMQVNGLCQDYDDDNEEILNEVLSSINFQLPKQHVNRESD